MIVITAEIESGFVAKDDLVPFRCSTVSSCAAPPQTEASIARRLRMIREDTGAPNEGATCAWIAADEAIGCTLAFLRMWQSSRQLVYRGLPEPGLRANDISRIHWSQHLLTTQSEWPN
ncbi:uncharacterized protein TNCV_4927941 [Trichonephila clavipes]|nr:uncharacterized protein TNCV_4927941 [Trichonephila clavipes]